MPDDKDYSAQAAEFIAGAERIAALELPVLPDNPAERAAMRAAGYDVLAEVMEVMGAVALVSVAGEDEEARHSVLSADVAAALGVTVARLAGREFLALYRETPEQGPELTLFRSLPAG